MIHPAIFLRRGAEQHLSAQAKVSLTRAAHTGIAEGSFRIEPSPSRRTASCRSLSTPRGWHHPSITPAPPPPALQPTRSAASRRTGTRGQLLQAPPLFPPRPLGAWGSSAPRSRAGGRRGEARGPAQSDPAQGCPGTPSPSRPGPPRRPPAPVTCGGPAPLLPPPPALTSLPHPGRARSRCYGPASSPGSAAAAT